MGVNGCAQPPAHKVSRRAHDGDGALRGKALAEHTLEAGTTLHKELVGGRDRDLTVVVEAQAAAARFEAFRELRVARAVASAPYILRAVC